jgi:hypothetical protein
MMQMPQPFNQGTLTGPPTTVTLQQMQELVGALNNSVVALGGIAQILTGFAIQVAGTRLVLPVSTVAALPAVTSANAGNLAWASNARNVTETGGNGTGALVAVNKNGVWFSVWSGVAPTT